jgi:SAM-dependent methyltransferase
MNASDTVVDMACRARANSDLASLPFPTETREEVDRVAKDRLFPSITNPSWIVLRARRHLFQRWLAQIPEEKLCILDVGGRIQPYRALLKGREQKYVAVDMRHSPLVAVVATAEQIPLRDEQFDLVICTQVLQYLQDPARAVAQMYRLLKPGGHLLLSVPAAYPRDSEHECWRFLPAGLQALVSSFGRIQIAAEGGTIAGLCRTLAVWLAMFVRPAFLRGVIRYSVVPILNVSAVALEPLFGRGNDQFAVNYSVFAQK